MSISIRFNPGELWTFRGQRLRFERHLGNDLLYFLDEARLGPFQVEDEDGALCAPSVEWALEAFAAGDLKRPYEPSGSPARTTAAFQDIEPRRVCRRPQLLRDRGHYEQQDDEQVFA